MMVNNFMDNQIYFWAHMLDEAFGANDTLLTEGDHWPEDYFRKLASKTNDEIAKKFVATFDPRAFDGDSTHRFSNTLISYFNKTVEWMLQSGVSQNEFISSKLPTIVNFLKTLEVDKTKEKELRPKIKAMPLQDFEHFMQDFSKQQADAEASKLAQQSFSNAKQYDVIKITSYKQMHELFGGQKTGDPNDLDSAWCHTNGEETYNAWISKGAGSNIFFVIASKDWQNQHYPENPTNALDKYGSSLCAILVSPTGKLLNSTLRYNHKCMVQDRGADSTFADWADLNQFYQQDIRSEVIAQMKDELDKAETEAKVAQAKVDEVLANATKINDVTLPDDIRRKITSITIPDSVESIGDRAFSCCAYLKEIVIPDSVTSIGRHAFSGCESLTSIMIPDSVTSIGKQAFFKCLSIKSVSMPNSVADIKYGTFAACEALTSIIIPNSVENIEDYAFFDCRSLKSITIPSSVTSIEEYTFHDCESLTSIMIPDSVTSIGDYAFEYCKSLESVTIPDSVESIGKWAFHNCMSLKSITFPGAVTSIGNDAFADCTSLISIIVPDNKTASIVLKNNPEVKDKIVIQPTNESKKFSRKQIKEAITYWEKQLK